jgi:hypothetical protein
VIHDCKVFIRDERFVISEWTIVNRKHLAAVKADGVMAVPVGGKFIKSGAALGQSDAADEFGADEGIKAAVNVEGQILSSLFKISVVI